MADAEVVDDDENAYLMSMVEKKMNEEKKVRILSWFSSCLGLVSC